MARGGYRPPQGGPRASGVGKNSKRADAGQKIDVPNVQDSTELTQGDRRTLEQGQQVQRIGSAQSPNIQAAGSAGTNPRSQQLPDYLLGMPSARPNEPETEGLDMGPGAGSEVLTPPPPQNDKEMVLQFLVDQFGDTNAEKMLQDIRGQRRPQMPMQAPAPAVTPEMAPQEPGEPEITDVELPIAQTEPQPMDEETAVV